MRQAANWVFHPWESKVAILLMKGTCMSVNEDITEIPLNARFVRRKTASMRVKG